MAQFTIEDVEKIERITGHSVFSDVVRNQLTSEFTQTVVDRALEILIELDNIDLLLKDALSTSFVTESRGSKLSYSAHVNHLKIEGTRLLKELTHLVSIEVKYNKYAPKKSNTISYW
jgi:hypothetical protein